MKLHRYFLLVFLILSVLIFTGCDTEDVPDNIQPPPEEGIFEPGSGEIGEDGHPVGWGETTHSKKAEPNYELLFDHNDVLRLDIVIAPADWQAMLDDMTEKFGRFGTVGIGSASITPGEFWKVGGEENPIYVPCDLVFQEKTWYHVGIRFKGNASLSTTWQSGSYKLPLRFNFDKFEDDYPEIKNQRFYGFDKLALASSAYDDSLVREKVTNEIFRSAGVPVGRDAFCRVFVDYGEGKKYFGLYTLQEIPAKPMLKSIFMDDDGNLYKPDGNGASFNTWDEDSFDKETNEDEADFSDVRELYDVLHSDRGDEAAFRTQLESIFNVDGFLHYLAVNQVISNWDTYGNIPHNYYLYHDPGDDLLHWIPWDFNLAMESVGIMRSLSLELGPNEVNQRWPLIRYLLDIPDYYDTYVFYVEKTIDEIFYPQNMHTILADAYELIKPYVLGDYGEVYGYSNLARLSNFDRAFTELNTHITNRYRAAQDFLQKYQEELNQPDDAPDASDTVDENTEAETPQTTNPPAENTADNPPPDDTADSEVNVDENATAETPDVTIQPDENTANDTPTNDTPDNGSVVDENLAAETPDVISQPDENAADDTPTNDSPDSEIIVDENVAADDTPTDDAPESGISVDENVAAGTPNVTSQPDESMANETPIDDTVIYSD